MGVDSGFGARVPAPKKPVSRSKTANPWAGESIPTYPSSKKVPITTKPPPRPKTVVKPGAWAGESIPTYPSSRNVPSTVPSPVPSGGGSSSGGGGTSFSAPAVAPSVNMPPATYTPPAPVIAPPVPVIEAPPSSVNVPGESFTSMGTPGSFGAYQRQRLNRGPRTGMSVTPEMLRRAAAMRLG